MRGMGEQSSKYLDDLFYVFKYAALLGLVAYGASLVSPALGVDVDYEMIHPGHTAFFSLDRWLLNLYRLAFPLSSSSLYFVRLLSISSLSLSAALFSLCIPASNTVRVIFSILAVSFPVNAYLLQFANQADIVSLGILCSTLSSLMLRRWLLDGCLWGAALMLPLAVLAMGPYQSTLFLLLTQYLAVIYLVAVEGNTLDAKASLLRRPAGAVVLAVASAGGAAVANKYLATACGALYGEVSSSYLTSHFATGDLPRRLNSLLTTLRRLYAGNLFPGSITAVCASLALLVTSAGIVSGNKSSLWKVFALFLLASIAVIPYAHMLVLDRLPARAMIALPFVVGFLCVLPLMRLGERALKPFCFAAAAVFLVNTHFNSMLFDEDYRNYKADNVLLDAVAARVYAVARPDSRGMYTVSLLGTWTHEPRWYFEQNEAFGFSKLSSGDDPQRLFDKLKLLGQSRFLNASPGQYEKARSLAESMPCWPAAGSVMAADGFVVVKLSGGEKK